MKQCQLNRFLKHLRSGVVRGLQIWFGVVALVRVTWTNDRLKQIRALEWYRFCFIPLKIAGINEKLKFFTVK